MILERIRRTECTRSWKSTLKACLDEMAVLWTAESWACAINCLDVTGDFPALQRLVTKYDEDVERADIDVRSFRLYSIGRMQQALGEYDLALAAYMRALAFRPGPDLQTLILLQTSTINVFLGEHEEASANLASIRDDAAARGDFISAAHACDFLAELSLKAGLTDDARVHVTYTREYAQRAGNLYRLDWVLILEGQLDCAAGEIDAGIARMRQAQRSFAKSGARGNEMHAALRLSRALMNAGRNAEAVTVAERGLTLASGYRYNAARLELLRLNADARRRTGKLTDERAAQALRRADILASRGQKVWKSLSGRTRVYSVADVEKYLETLDPTLFEVVCKQILESEGFRCTMAPLNEAFIDVIAEKHTAKGTRWGVSCKRVIEGIRMRDVPDSSAVATVGCNGFMAMTTGRVSVNAARKIAILRRRRLPVDTWDGVRLCEFLAAHDWILADVGTRLP